jgi:hypothetical protein
MTIVTQQTRETGKSAARLFWEEQMDKYPKIHGVLSILGSVCGYVFNGHIVLAAAKWAITVGGRIATSILFFAALWVAGRSTEPASLAHVLSYMPLIHFTAPQVDHAAILSFTLLPEILLLGAGLTTIEQWVGVKRQGGLYWVWALIYSLLTALFLGITIYTFISFLVNGSASVVISASGKADGATLIRALTGWSYALLELLHAGVGARYSSAPETTPAISPVDLQAMINQTISGLTAQLQENQAHLFEELAGRMEQRVQLLEVKQQTALTTIQEEAQTAREHLTPERLMASLSGPIETLLAEHLNVSPASMRQLNAPKVSPEKREKVSPGARNMRILTPQKVSRHPVRQDSETSGESTNSARIYTLLDEDRGRKPADIQRLTGIPKATVYRIVERYHRDNPVIEAGVRSEIETPEETGDETETANETAS